MVDEFHGINYPSNEKRPKTDTIGTQNASLQKNSLGKQNLTKSVALIRDVESVLMLVNGYDGLCTDVDYWILFAKVFAHLTVYIAFRENEDVVQDYLIGQSDDHLHGGWTASNPACPDKAWAIFSLKHLLRVWKSGSSDDKYGHLIERMDGGHHTRIANKATYGPDGIRPGRNGFIRSKSPGGL